MLGRYTVCTTGMRENLQDYNHAAAVSQAQSQTSMNKRCNILVRLVFHGDNLDSMFV